MTKGSQAFRTIREVADWLGLATHVLRFWESKFPQIKPVKRAGGRRYYRPADMQLVGGIKVLLHDDGMTIRGVQKLIRKDGVDAIKALSPPLDDLLSAGVGPGDEVGTGERDDWLRDAQDDAAPAQPDLPLDTGERKEATPDAAEDELPAEKPAEDMAEAPKRPPRPPMPKPPAAREPRSVAATVNAATLDAIGDLARNHAILSPDARARLRGARGALAALRDRMRADPGG